MEGHGNFNDLSGPECFRSGEEIILPKFLNRSLTIMLVNSSEADSVFIYFYLGSLYAC